MVNYFLMTMCILVLLVGVFMIHKATKATKATYVGEVLLGWFTVMVAVAASFMRFS